LVFISDNFVFGNLDNLAPSHHEAVGGFFDASQERAGNTSFEGYEANFGYGNEYACEQLVLFSGRVTEEPPLFPPDGDDRECHENSQ
jgi:hypothetical protein